MPRLLRHPAIWFFALLVWFGTLWVLSSLKGVPAPQPFPHFDKFEHFTYFLAGGALCAGWLVQLRPERPAWGKIILATILVLAMLGGIDEWHQCYTPGRSGGDIWDGLADVLGATAGAFTLRAFVRWFQ